MKSDSSSLPRDLADVITRDLPSSTKRSLFQASHFFGQQPSSDFVTRLVLAVPASDSCQQQCIKERLVLITSLTLSGSDGSGHSQAGPQPSPPLCQLVARIAPSMPHLTHLRLLNISLDTVASAMPSLGASCPHLTGLELEASPAEGRPNPRAALALFSALADVATLRHLRLSVLRAADDAASSGKGARPLSLHGVGAVTQLRSLTAGGRDRQAGTLPLMDLSCLVGLTQLCLHNVVLSTPPRTAAGLAQHLCGLTRLQHLELLEVETAHAALNKLVALCSAGPSITHLRLASVDDAHPLLYTSTPGDDRFLVGWNALRPSYTQLVRLDLGILTVNLNCADPLDWPPTLRALRCDAVNLPQSGAGVAAVVALPRVRVLDCNRLMRALNEAGNYGLAWGDEEGPVAQSLAQTFPGLAALRWGLPARTGHLADDFLATLSHLLPDTAAGRLVHLRRLACDGLVAPFLGSCMGGVQDLVVGPGQAPDEEYGGIVQPPLGALVIQLQSGGPRPRRVELCEPHARDADVAALVLAWPGAEEVVVRGSGTLSDIGLAALVGLPRLRRVTLVRCPAITMRGIQRLVASWSVQYIGVCGCARVGALEVAALHNRPGSEGRCWGLRPQLDVVHSEVEGEALPWWRGEEGVEEAV